MSTERLSIEQEQELNKLLSAANFNRARGQLAEAEDSCRKALKITPNDASIHEMLGDILHEAEKLEPALDEYKAATALAPGKASLEKKYAKVTLDIGERDYQKALSQDMLDHPEKYRRIVGKRSVLIAVMCSAILPGFGQIYKRQVAKGIIIFALSALLPVTIALQEAMAPGSYHTITDLFRDPTILFCAFMSVFAYVYGLIDAAAPQKGPKNPADV